MGRRFTGWSGQAFAVLLQLEGDPTVAEREGLRRDREQLVRQPMIALLQDMADVDSIFEDFSVWSYATTNFWWQHQFGIIRIARKVEFGLRFDLDGLQVSGGWSYGDAAQIERYRAAVSESSSGSQLADLTRTLESTGFERSGDTLKRMPKGYTVDHPRADLLRHRALREDRWLGSDDLDQASVVDRVLATCAELDPLMEWFVDHVAVEGVR